ncbi:MAG: hypothetical protein H7Z11_08440, partial [Verrucomicrobia bacterium]|nr:hypothetical protein [Leptolyngbya sp. ES-bin-22]
MSFDEILAALNTRVETSEGRPLHEAEMTILRGTWEGLTYPEIAKGSAYSLNYLKQDVGPNVWKLLSRMFTEEVSKFNFRSLIESHILFDQEAALLPVMSPDPTAAYQNVSQAMHRLDHACLEASKAAIDNPRTTLLLHAYVQTLTQHLKRFRKSMSDLEQGTIQIAGHYRLEVINQLLRQYLQQIEVEHSEPAVDVARSALYAVSYGDIHRWWETALAQEFRDLNGELAKYIHVERIFILPHQDAVENMQTTMQWHRHLNINVYVLVSDDPELRASFMVCEQLFTNLVHISRSGEEV